MTKRLTFKQLAKLDPRLMDLYNEAIETKDPGGPSFCANYVWYKPGGLKERLTDLVGWGAETPELRSTEAYDLAYLTIYDALPNCRNCNCM